MSIKKAFLKTSTAMQKMFSCEISKFSEPTQRELLLRCLLRNNSIKLYQNEFDKVNYNLSRL